MSYLAQMPATWVVVHEVQRLPGLLNEIHRIISERGSYQKFALIGLGAGLGDPLEANLIPKAFGVYRGDRELLDGAVRVLLLMQFVKALQNKEVIG